MIDKVININLDSFGKRLRYIGRLLYRNDRQFADALGISPQRLSGWITNASQPHISILNKLTEYGISVQYLVTGKGAMFIDAATGKPIDLIPQGLCENPELMREYYNVGYKLHQSNPDEYKRLTAVLSNS